MSDLSALLIHLWAGDCFGNFKNIPHMAEHWYYYLYNWQRHSKPSPYSYGIPNQQLNDWAMKQCCSDQYEVTTSRQENMPTAGECEIWNHWVWFINLMRSNLYISLSNIGRSFRSHCGARSKMAALPLPVAILDDLISPGNGNEVIQDGDRKRKGRHLAPHSAMGIEKFSLGLWWHHFRRRHLGWRHPRWQRPKWRLEDVGTLVKTPSRHLPRQSWVMPSSQKGPKNVL